MMICLIFNLGNLDRKSDSGEDMISKGTKLCNPLKALNALVLKHLDEITSTLDRCALSLSTTCDNEGWQGLVK